MLWYARMRMTKFVLIVSLACSLCRPASASDDSKDVTINVLILFDLEPSVLIYQQVFGGILDTLSGFHPLRSEIYADYLDLDRFKETHHQERIRQSLLEKYKDRNIDVIITTGLQSLKMAISVREQIGRDAKIVFGGVTSRQIEQIDLPALTRGLFSSVDPTQNLELARRLQPEANRIVVMAGSSVFRQNLLKRIKAAFPAEIDGIKIEYVTGLKYDEYIKFVRGLDRKTILLFFGVRVDAAGQEFVAIYAMEEIARASSTPLYTVFPGPIGTGALGGFVAPYDVVGNTLGELAIEAYQGMEPRILSLATLNKPIVDWRVLRRFGIDPERLPEGTDVRFMQFSVWDQHKPEILLSLALAATLIASAFVFAVIERKRRTTAHSLNEERLELSRLSRLTHLGVLSGALAHELNQPLSAMLYNSEMAKRKLEERPPDTQEVAAILSDIREDNERAATVVRQLRFLFGTGEVEKEEVDLDELVRSTLKLVKSETSMSGVKVTYEPPPEPKITFGSRTQIQQVINNVLVNALDELETVSRDRRQVALSHCPPDGDMLCLSISDSGNGFSSDMTERALRPFSTTKEGGMGLGLAVSRLIVEAHGGKLEIDSTYTSGARLLIYLPMHEAS